MRAESRVLRYRCSVGAELPSVEGGRDVGLSPFRNSSTEGLTMLLRLCFNRSEVEDMMRGLSGESEAGLLGVGRLYQKLAEDMKTEPSVAQPVDREVKLRLERFKVSFERGSLFQIVNEWTMARESGDLDRALGLLWLVVRSPAPSYRKIEASMVDDLLYLQARALMQRTTNTTGQPSPMVPAE